MAQPLGITRLLNDAFGAPLTSLLRAIGIHPSRPGAPITDGTALELLVALGLILFLITFAVLALARLMLRSQVRA